jgi:EAL domain-containing protein (putative c-di-GMP-specific phosphodiesterase class I)
MQEIPPAQADLGKRLNPSPNWCLEGYASDDGVAVIVPMTAWPFRIGRSRDASLCLPDPSVSKQHAEIDHDGVTLWICDSNSTNGTFVNGNRVEGRRRLKHGDLVHFANLGFSVVRGDVELCNATSHVPLADVIAEASRFDRLFDLGNSVPYYQPLVSLSDRRLLGYEVLARSEVEGMEQAKEMFTAASRLKLADELSRFFRVQGVETVRGLKGDFNLFLNTHPSELHDSMLVASLRSLREKAPQRRLTLEIHEAAVTDPGAMRQLRTALRELDIGLAYDDFGAGRDRLLDLAEVPPDVLKFDARFIRDIHLAGNARRQIVGTLVAMARDLGIVTVAEGIETEEEGAVCRELNFQYAQGYYYGRPAAAHDLTAGVT